MAFINDMANEILSFIFQCLHPNERVRIERVCRRWCIVSRELSWYNQSTLLLDGQDLVQNYELALSKYISLIQRCGRQLSELNLKGMYSRNAFVEDQLWSSVPNLQHLCFEDSRTSSYSMQSIATKLPHLKSVAFSDIDGSCITNLNLFISNAKLQFLRISVDKFPERLSFPALSSSLCVLNIYARRTGHFNFSDRKSSRIFEILQSAAIHCPKLSVLMLPIEFPASERILEELSRFSRLFYLRLCLRIPDVSLFAMPLQRIGMNLRALLLETVDGKILHRIAKYCPNLEHISFDFPNYNSSRHLAGLQSVLQLPLLRSVSIGFVRDIGNKKSSIYGHILSILRKLADREELEYFQISREFPLPLSFISELFRRNSKLSKISCRLHRGFTQIELEELNMVLSTFTNSTHRTITLNLIGFCPALIDRNNLRIRLVKFREDIDQTLLRQFCARVMASIPTIWHTDD